MKDWLLNILRMPDTGAPLTWNPDTQRLTAGDTAIDTEDGIPSFVAKEPAEGCFDYTKHYATDAEVFDYFEEENDRLIACHLDMLRTTVLRQVPREARLVLDVGCGCAYVAARLCPQGRNVVSLDIARANVRKAVESHPFAGHGGVVADAYHLPFADNVFDCIVASEIIEHTVDPRGFLASLATKLKPGGTLVVSTPYKERIAYSLCIHCNCKTPHNAHLHSFDESSMHRMADTIEGLSVNDIQYVGNKVMLRCHLTVPLACMGYGMWHACDATANRLVPKAEHFVIKFSKA